MVDNQGVATRVYERTTCCIARPYPMPRRTRVRTYAPSRITAASNSAHQALCTHLDNCKLRADAYVRTELERHLDLEPLEGSEFDRVVLQPSTPSPSCIAWPSRAQDVRSRFEGGPPGEPLGDREDDGVVLTRGASSQTSSFVVSSLGSALAASSTSHLAILAARTSLFMLFLDIALGSHVSKTTPLLSSMMTGFFE